MTPQDTRIAFFGGANNAAALDAVIALAKAGFDITVCDHDPREAVALRGAGVTFCSTRAEALAGRSVVLTCEAAPDDVEELFCGSDGLLEVMQPGSTAIDLSFSLPQLAREIHAMGAISDIQVFDAPLVRLGDSESTTIFVGGQGGRQSSIEPLLPHLATRVWRFDEPGEGQFAAMLAHISFAGSLMGTVESLAIARIAEFPREATLDVLASTAGASRALAEYAPRIMAGSFDGNLKVADLLQALEVVLEAADSLDVTVPMTETAAQLFDLLSTVGGEDLDVCALALLYADEQTCASHGLDWELASSEDFDADDDGPGAGFGLGDFFEMGSPGDDDDDSESGGHFPYSGFFSKN